MKKSKEDYKDEMLFQMFTAMLRVLWNCDILTNREYDNCIKRLCKYMDK